MSDGEQKIIKEQGEARLIIVDTTSDVHEGNDTDVIVTGSHSGQNSGEYLAHNNIKGTIGNDAGMGKNDAGIVGLKILEGHDIPAAAVASMSAKIGNGTSTYEQGKISAVNGLAKELGITVGMSAREAADKMLEDADRKTK